MKENSINSQVKENLKKWKKELEQLEKNKSPLSSIPKSSSNDDLGYLRATEEMKRRIQLRGLIRNALRELYKSGTDSFAQELTDLSDIPEFSWGIRELERRDREIIFEGAGNGEYIKVTNYGSFEYMTGKSGVSIQDIPDSNYVKIPIEHFLRYRDQIRILPTDIKEALKQHPEYLAERLNLIRVTKGTGENQRDYFILSPIQRHYLEDEEVREVFVNEYCSDEYLNSVVNGENGRYAGNIVREKDGICAIRYQRSSVRAAKLAELVPETTELHFNMLDGEERKLPARQGTFKQILDRFLAETINEKQNQVR